jgi:hypothetical protein
MASDLSMPETVSLAVTSDAWTTAQRRERWRRRLLPLAGGALLLCIWWALIAIFHVRSFIALAPDVVAPRSIRSSTC